MNRHFFRRWLHKYLNFTQNPNHDTIVETNNADSAYEFSPLTYQNPCIFYIHPILNYILKEKNISYQKLELIIVDADQGHDDDMEDIKNILSELVQGLNYLLLITDEPDSYLNIIEEIYDENGLIVQQIPKSEKKNARGNLILDFERHGGISADHMIRPNMVYLPIYKKPWEISENLDIIVPVGYNTLVIDSIPLPYQSGEYSHYKRFMNDKIDRLDREFRKG